MSHMSMDEMIEVLARYRYNAKHDADRIKALEDELSRLRASSFVTAVPAEQYERVIKAGDAMANVIQSIDFEREEYYKKFLMTPKEYAAVQEWFAVKKGVQS